MPDKAPIIFPDAVGTANAAGSIGGGISALTGALFGTAGSTTVNGKATTKANSTSRLDIDEEGVNKILADILGSEEGLASIFSKEQVAGLYDSTAASQGAGDLVTKLAGEIAKLQATTVKTESGVKNTEDTTENKTSGLFDFLGL